LSAVPYPNTALDTNVILDLLIPAAPHQAESERAIAEASAAGGLVICEAVYAELAAAFPIPTDLVEFLAATAIRLERSSVDALDAAGTAWRACRRRRRDTLQCTHCGHIQSAACARCGKAIGARQHLATDFLVGAHARLHAGRLLTRDRGFYRTYFPDLSLA